jgi:hypothetical protein
MTDEQIKEIMVLVNQYGHECWSDAALEYDFDSDDATQNARAAVESALRAAVPDVPEGWVMLDKNGVVHRNKWKRIDFFGSVGDTGTAFTIGEVAYESREWPGLAPFTVRPVSFMAPVAKDWPMEEQPDGTVIPVDPSELIEASTPQAPQAAQPVQQALTDPENQPNQYGFECFMKGQKMAFKIGNQTFTLDYEPDETEEFDFMRDMLANAFSTFTPDVKTAQQAGAVLKPLSDAESDVLAERQRQISDEGWTPEHDDEHDRGDLVQAAACYALHSAPIGSVRNYLSFWPWDARGWKPKDRRSNLIKAGALIIAEIERLDRAHNIREN